MLTVFLFTLNFLCAQDFDLIVTVKGDSIACETDSITDTHIYFKMKNRNNWVSTFLSNEQVAEYKSKSIDKNLLVFKPGTSYITSYSKKTAYKLRKNSFYYELLGIGLFFGSVNYDRLIPITKKTAIGLRGGLGIYEKVFFVGEFNVLIGTSKHFFECGVGTPFTDIFFMPMFRAGYRYQGPKGLLIRAAPMYFRAENDNDEIKNMFWFGLSIGYSL